MNLQYISDNQGKTTGVYIPIQDWEYLKNRYKDIEQEENNSFDIPEWHKNIIRERLLKYRNNPDDVMNWKDVQKKIEQKYGF